MNGIKKLENIRNWVLSKVKQEQLDKNDIRQIVSLVLFYHEDKGNTEVIVKTLYIIVSVTPVCTYID